MRGCARAMLNAHHCLIMSVVRTLELYLEVDYRLACTGYLAKLVFETPFYPSFYLSMSFLLPKFLVFFSFSKKKVFSFLPHHVILVDLPLALMDDKSKKGKEKDGSASTPPNRPKVSIFCS